MKLIHATSEFVAKHMPLKIWARTPDLGDKVEESVHYAMSNLMRFDRGDQDLGFDDGVDGCARPHSCKKRATLGKIRHQEYENLCDIF